MQGRSAGYMAEAHSVAANAPVTGVAEDAKENVALKLPSAGTPGATSWVRGQQARGGIGFDLLTEACRHE